MTLPEQFNEDNIYQIRIYHYVEELVQSYRNYMTPLLEKTDITMTEAPFIIRLRFSDKNTQQNLAKMFKVSEGYTAKLLRKFEEKGLITRVENPHNRREKIVTLTQEGIAKTDEIITLMDNWEHNILSGLDDESKRVVKENLFKMVNSQF
jgi:DNA-binding MarR family transcriptional regulator